jgi:hypothetical protein
MNNSLPNRDRDVQSRAPKDHTYTKCADLRVEDRLHRYKDRMYGYKASVHREKHVGCALKIAGYIHRRFCSDPEGCAREDDYARHNCFQCKVQSRIPL